MASPVIFNFFDYLKNPIADFCVSNYESKTIYTLDDLLPEILIPSDLSFSKLKIAHHTLVLNIHKNGQSGILIQFMISFHKMI